ncbi:MAG: hypothetical protein NTV56_19350, partial [Alphaproteobacteria bacterium]|nr:hypothetical protein [Alphaproteobacteria bacterium]
FPAAKAKGKDADTSRQRGSELNANIPRQGVNIASDFARRIEAIRALPPEQAVIGITAHDCCELCGPTECVLAGGQNLCLHPAKSGYPAHLHNDRVVQAFRKAAVEEIRASEEDDHE